jgi:multimeric flavodoxin WrbA
MKEVVIFNGSPRVEGNISTLLRAVHRGAEDAGAMVKTYNLHEMKYMACSGCFSCRMNDDCAINDELHAALQLVKKADAVVVGSPIYMMQMTGPVKNMYDRLFPLTDIDYKPRFGKKKMLTVYSQGMGDAAMFESYFEYTAGTMFPPYGFELMDNIVCTNGSDPESAIKNDELMSRAYKAGQRLVIDN